MATVSTAIRFSDLDAYGHVSYAVYLDYLEPARSRTLGLGTLWDYVVVRAAINYRSEIRYEEGIVVATCELRALGTSSARTVEQLTTRGGRVLADCEVVVVCFDRGRRASSIISGDLRKALEKLLPR